MKRSDLTLADLARSLEKFGIRRLYLNEPLAPLGSPRKNVPEVQVPLKEKQPRKSSQPYIRNLRRFDPSVIREKEKRLKAIEEPLRSCEKCRLFQGRTNLVFGVGNPDADILFVGEGPGRDEDQQGEPFVGRAGQLLTDMIVKGMRIRREDVYIANIVKCRPPGNRNPEPDEMIACLPHLEAQIEIIDPRVIVTLGAVPARALLKEKKGVTKLRGNWKSYGSIPVMPTLHPAYLLRNPAAKKDCWEDLKQVIAFMNGELDPAVARESPRSLF